ncbi:MAG: 2OG-Fe(II) oxygenase [Methylophilaceae bacterium]
MLSLKIQSIIDAIDKEGYAVIEDFLALNIVDELADEADMLQQQGAMKVAKTGTVIKNNPVVTNPRGDFIYWLEEQELSSIQNQYWQAMQALQRALNQHFYLGLFDLEAHYAIYPTGAVYHKHLDQFREKQDRKISIIFYLNHDWSTKDGGALRLYLNKDSEIDYIDIQPDGGKLVVFLSDQFFHEVLPATRERRSLTGWFRQRGSQLS